MTATPAPAAEPDPSRARAAACSVERALGVVSEPWTFLVLREAWFGQRRFGDFVETLGIPRGTLSKRLEHLVAEGLFKKVEYQSRPPRHEYRLTARGADLYPPMIVMLRWGDRWLAGDAGPPLLLHHRVCGHRSAADVACSRCRETIHASDVSWRRGPGADATSSGGARAERRPTRRSSKPENFTRPRTDSVARTMSIIGDRWTFLLIREAFFGVRNFDEARRNLGIATNILSNRIARLVEAGVFERKAEAAGSSRHHYRFTEKGRDLYHSMIALLRWGDDWLDGGKGPPLILTHATCGKDFTPAVVCSHCRCDILMHEMAYGPGPGWQVNRGAGLIDFTWTETT